MSQITVLGEALIDLFAESGVALHEAKTFQPAPGGATANVAVALGRLGADVSFIGKVGEDGNGRYLIDLFADAGVDVTHFVTDPGGPTMLALVALPNPTEPEFVIYNGANGLLRTEELPKAEMLASQIYIYSAVTLPSDSREAAVEGAKWARDAGQHVIFDVNLRPLQWPNLELARQQIEGNFAIATVVKLNEHELEFFTHTDDPAKGSQFLVDQGVQLCCVSLGAEGAYFNNGRAQGHVPTFAVDVQDTTGCGDAFVAGLAIKLLELDKPLSALDEAELRSMILFANACGALTATQVGGMTAAPSLEAVGALLGSQATF